MAGWTAVGIAGVGLGYSIYSGEENKDQQEEAYKKQGQYSDKIADIAEAEWNRYVTLYGPLEEKAIHDVQAPLPQQPGYTATMAGIERDLAGSKADLRRTMGTRYPYGSGLESGYMLGLNLEGTRTKAGAAVDLERGRRDRELQLLSLGKGMPAQVSSTYGNMVGQYGNMAGQYGAQSAAAYRTAGGIAGDLTSYYMMQPKTTTSTPTYSTPTYQSPSYPVAGQDPYTYDYMGHTWDPYY